MAGIKRLHDETDSEYWDRIGRIVDSLDCVKTCNGQVIARYPKEYRIVPFAADVLTGFLDYEEAKDEKYALAN